MQEVIPGVHSWREYSSRLGYQLNGFWWRDGDDVVVVDPPEPTGAAREHMAGRGRPGLIVVTNRSHWRATDEVRESSGAAVAMSAIDSEAVEGPVDRILTPGEELPGGWQVLDMAGKTLGEIGLYRASGGGVVIVGDTLIGDPPGELRLLPPEKIEDRELLLASLARLVALDFDVLLVGDGEHIRHDAGGRVREFVRQLVT